MIGPYVSSVHWGAFGNMYAAKAISEKLKSIISRLVFPLQHRGGIYEVWVMQKACDTTGFELHCSYTTEKNKQAIPLSPGLRGQLTWKHNVQTGNKWNFLYGWVLAHTAEFLF